MNLPTHIVNRRSVFPQFFTEQPVAPATLHALLQAANQAPSHRKTEPWRYWVYQDQGKAVLLQDLRTAFERKNGPGTWDNKLEKKFGQKISQSPVVLLIFLHRDPQESVPEWEEIAAVGCSVQNIWTSLDQFGLGGYWSSPGFICGGYGEYPGTPDNYRCMGMFYLGHQDAPDLPRPRGPWSEKVNFINSAD